ncbi:MAG: methionine--tRNA ligase [Candidatus Helarchaeota archaeon]|nr:methionine--tRNA ligase [Candidatus Helarchaeota archaeon]
MSKEKWVVTSAWPYAYGIPHLGNFIQPLSADVFARYLRSNGAEVVLVSGSDEHGTPNAAAAIKQGLEPKELTDKIHASISDLFKKWAISFDNYTRTHNPVHIEYVQDFYRTVFNNGYIFTQEIQMLYCPKDKFFLPDRYVEGKCPHCGSNARGDQCESCDRLLEPTDLLEPYCTICKTTTPIIKKTKHWYFDFKKFETPLKNFIKSHPVIPDNARNWCLGILREGLKPRAITRDLKWGIPAPFPGSEGKSVYVWFEAVLGYVSATKQWAEINNKPNYWKDFWFKKETKTVFFIGKDNIPFHLLIFPALLLATELEYVLPYNVSSTEYLQYDGQKFSKSHNIGIWIDEALELAPVDYWRYSLIASRPELKDVSFSLSEFATYVNSDLNDVLGNFIHRTLTFITNYFEGKVPESGPLDDNDKELIQAIKETPQEVAQLIEAFKFKAALREVIGLSRKGNNYLSVKEPWHQIKTDKQKTGTTLNLSIQLVRTLAILLSPFIPNSCRKIWNSLNLKSDFTKASWTEASELSIPSGHLILPPKPLFFKIKAKKIKSKLKLIRQRTEIQQPKLGGQITLDEFRKLDIRIGKIIDTQSIKGADKLIKLIIDIGERKIQCIAGLKHIYKPEELIGKLIAVLVNLQPTKLRGELSEGMILAAIKDNIIKILVPDGEIELGSKIF